MKISKLFHWLYAILMLLPFAFFVPSVLYYAFNDNATMQSVEVPITKTVAVDFNQLARPINTTYYQVANGGANIGNNSISFDSNGTVDEIQKFSFLNGHRYLISAKAELTNFLGNTSIISYAGYSYVYNVTSSGYHSFLVDGVTHLETINFVVSNYSNGLVEYSDFNLFDLTQMFGSGNEPTIAEFKLMFPLDYYDYVLSQPMEITYNTGETMELVENTNIINYAWESIWDLPLFIWCKVSFVTTPFTYITGLFGLAASNSLNYVFTYFASMSIIWLVFDVIMYVPLLVHRWIDKGIVE